MEPRFSEYTSADIAARWGCIHCHTTLDPSTIKDDDYPNGRGRYKLTCMTCKMSTWFDLKNEETLT